MNTRKLIVLGLVALVLLAFALGTQVYQRQTQQAQADKVAQETERLVRMHAPVLGPQNAPVTIVEFFDPACETCRAFYPLVKELLQRYPDDVRLVIRYAPLHQGSDQVVRLLEAAKRQGRYWPVLEAVLAAQPLWADHGQPNVALAFEAAAQTGLLDMARVRADAGSESVTAILQQDIADLTALGVNKTPTFFVNGRPLPTFGADPLKALVAEEVAKNRTGLEKGKKMPL